MACWRGVEWLATTVTILAFWVCTDVHGLIEPIPMPEYLEECYKHRTRNVSITEVPSQDINALCITQFLYSTAHLRPQRPMANESLLYVQEILRQVLGEHREYVKHTRSRRQTMGGGVDDDVIDIVPSGTGETRVNSRLGPRREVRTLSTAEWQRFAGRINQLKRTPLGRSNRYDALAELHTRYLGIAHNGPNFLGWHRVYCAIVERAIGIALPYWDSRFDFYMRDPTRSAMWTGRLLGNGFGPVNTGPFANWMTPTGMPLVRNIASGGSLITDGMLQQTLSITDIQAVTEPGGPFTIERIHNGVHVWVDGQFGSTRTTAYDPIFYLHHAFVDYIFTLFRRGQRNAGLDPTALYPQVRRFFFSRGQRGQSAMAPMFPGVMGANIRCIDGLDDYYERDYDATPSCANDCSQSAYLTCMSQRPQRCVALPSRVMQHPLNPVIHSIRFPFGDKFNSQFVDQRTRNDALLSAPIPASTPMNVWPRPTVLSHWRRRRSASPVSLELSNSETSHINKPYQNTFELNGVSDIDLWAFVQVKIIFERPPEVKIDNYKIKESKKIHQATHKHCFVSGSGASKVYVQTDGIDYSGKYKDYAVVDERLPISSYMTYIGVKNPTEGAAQFYMTAYDSCGRVCRPVCFSGNGYKPCSGAFRITSDFPKMYGINYEDAVQRTWKKGKLFSESNVGETPVVFVCESQITWPWAH